MKTFSANLVLAFAIGTRAAAQTADTTEASAHSSLDSVYTADQVGKLAWPAKQRNPEYPESLRRRNIQGSVTVKFVVDTPGLADSTTIVITSSTNSLFSASARKAIINTTYAPAELNGRKVKQSVQQMFTFTIEQDERDEVR